MEHEKGNQYKLWITWAITLALLRVIKDISVSIYDPLSILIVVIFLAISTWIGVFKYKDIYKDKREVYYTESLINDYKDKGRNILKKEVKTAVFIFAIFVLLMTLFLIYGWLIWLFFGIICFGTFIYSICGLPLDRFKLYK